MQAVTLHAVDSPSIITTTDKVILPSKPLIKRSGEKFSIQILDSINPHRFWFAEYSEFRRLRDLMKKMTKFYKARHTDLKINLMHIQKGLHVAVDYYGEWHRSVILNVMADNVVRVFYIDYGTVEDEPLKRVCYLMEEFITEPSFAQRGVLGLVQPTGGKWDQEGIDFFTNLTKKKAQAKFFDKNPSDSSYVLSIRVANKKNLSDYFIDKNYCIADSDFLNKEKVNYREGELDFADYEAGKHESNDDKIVDWLPKALRGQYSVALHEIFASIKIVTTL